MTYCHRSQCSGFVITLLLLFCNGWKFLVYSQRTEEAYCYHVPPWYGDKGDWKCNRNYFLHYLTAHQPVEIDRWSSEMPFRNRKATNIDIIGSPCKFPCFISKCAAWLTEIPKYIKSLVEEKPDIYISELQNALFAAYNIEADRNTITQVLYQHGFTWKQVHIEIISLILNLVQFTTLQLLKITCPAHKQDDEQRARFQANIGENYSPETLVFLDESACNRITGWQSKGWAPIGKRAQKHDYFVRGQRYFCHLHFLLIIVHWLAKLRYSILPAISLDGVLHLELSCNPGLLMSFVHSLTYCWTKWTLICKRTPSLFSIMWLHAILMTCMRLLKVKVCVFTTSYHTPQTSIPSRMGSQQWKPVFEKTMILYLENLQTTRHVIYLLYFGKLSLIQWHQKKLWDGTGILAMWCRLM